MMDDIRRIARALPTLWRVGVASIVAYRAEMIIWILSATLPLVMMAIWNAATEEAPLGLFGPTEVTRYFAVTMVVRQLTGAWVLWELNYMIRTGSLSPQLLRPVNPLVYNLCETVAAIPWRLLVLAPIVGALVVWRPEILVNPGPARIVAFVLSVALAFLIAWLVQVIFGLAAFWLEQSQGLFSVYFAMWAFLSGYVVPAPLLPEGVDVVARYLPFYATLGAPVDILTDGTSEPLGAVLASQLGWVVVLGVCTVVLWRRGVRRYGAVGA
jgi:ABC-2 type transport system permease protein